MTVDKCPDCKGTRVYLGLGFQPPEPCRTCCGPAEDETADTIEPGSWSAADLDGAWTVINEATPPDDTPRIKKHAVSPAEMVEIGKRLKRAMGIT